MRPLRWRRLWLAIGVALATAVTVACLLPNPERFAPLGLWDKYQHVLAFAVLGGWFGCVARLSRFSRVAIGLLALALLIECLQGLSGYRDFDLADIVADMLGVAAGLTAAATPLGTSLIRIERVLINSYPS